MKIMISVKPDLFLVFLLSLLSFLLGNLKSLQILPDHSQLLLKINDFRLPRLGSLLGPHEVALYHGELPGHLVVLDVALLHHLLGLLQLVLRYFNSWQQSSKLFCLQSPHLLCSSIMFLVSRTLIALLIESARAEASDSSFDVIVPLESDLRERSNIRRKSEAVCISIITFPAHPPTKQSFAWEPGSLPQPQRRPSLSRPA